MSEVPESMRLIVAVDLDEVLGAFVEALASWHNEHHGTTLTSNDFHSYHFRDVWGGTDDETRGKMNKFFESSHFDSITSVKESAAVLRQLKNAFCKFIVVTSRDHVIADRTRAWLDVHFHGIFDDVLFGNHYGVTGKKTPKSELCAQIGAHVLIDDSLSYALEAASVVPTVITFGQYAWNSGPAKVQGEVAVPGHATGPAPHAAEAAGSGSGPGAHKPGAPPASAVVLPHNVVRAINWRHVAAILGRLKPRLVPSSAAAPPAPVQPQASPAASAPAEAPAATGDRNAPAPAAAAAAPSATPAPAPALGPTYAWPQPTVRTRDGKEAPALLKRDAIAVSFAHFQATQGGFSGGSGRPKVSACAHYADLARKSFELCQSVTLTGLGDDTRLATEAATMLERVGDAVITGIRTGADAARPVPGAARPPRITITVTRTPSLLLRRFGAERSIGLVAAARAAPTAHAPALPAGVPAPRTAASDILSPIAVPVGPDSAGAPPASELAAAREEAAAALSDESSE